MQAINEPKIRVGVSSCLLGQNVRYDGGHKLDHFVTDVLGLYVEFIAVCPEAELGLGVPREPMHLQGDPQRPRMVTVHTNIDHTDAMEAWARTRVLALEDEDLCGFILKSKSPSCGKERVKVYDERGLFTRTGTGLFARILTDHFPLLPVDDEGRLNDPDLRENFIERLFVCRRWKELMAPGATREKLLNFHTRHKLLLMAHDPRRLRQLGNLVAEDAPLNDILAPYQTLLQETLSLIATVKKNVNVLQHILGYFKRQLGAEDKRELLDAIDNYRRGYVPLIVPITLVNHYVRKHQEGYLMAQWYLHPHPIELKLRNHA